MSEAPQNGMTKFWLVFGHYKRLLLAAGTASLLPFVAEFADASTPISGITPITSLLLVVAAVITFQFFDGSSRKKVNARITSFLIFGSASLIMYLVASLRFIYHYENGKVILGCGWTNRAIDLANGSSVSVAAQCPGEYQALLTDLGGSVARVFTSQNVAYVEMLLAATWLCFFLSMAAIIALFVTFQQNRKIKA